MLLDFWRKTLLLALLGGSGAMLAQTPPITTIAEIRRLARTEAEEQLPARIEGVVTYRSIRRGLLFVQDETAGTYVATGRLPPELNYVGVGVRVELEGVTRPGGFAPHIGPVDGETIRMRVLGEGRMPEPLRLSLDQLIEPRHDCQWIEVTGVVRAVEQRPIEASPNHDVFIHLAGGRSRLAAMLISIEADVPLPTHLVGSTVRVCGVYGTLKSETRQSVGMLLHVNALTDFTIEQPGTADPFSLPVRPISSLMQYDPDWTLSERVRIQGVATIIVPGRGLYLEQEGAGTWVESRDVKGLRSGENVDAVGFVATGSWRPVLENAIVRSTGMGHLLEPSTFGRTELLSGQYDLCRVRIEGRLIRSAQLGDEAGWLLDQEGQVLVARFSGAGIGVDPRLVSMRPGSLLEIVGVCLNQRSGDLRRELTPAWTPTIRPVSYQLLIGAAADVRVLQQAPWWTRERLLGGLAALLLLAVGALAWVVQLRLKVERQTGVIARKIEQERLHEERARIARDLHDKLEQDFIGLTLLLDTAAKRLVTAPDRVRESIELAKATARHAQAEARSSVWDLRVAATEALDFPTLLRQMLESGAQMAPPSLEIKVEGSPRPLESSVVTVLLRTAQEAVSNARKHAQATRILVIVRFAVDSVLVAVEDDGIGFDVKRSSTALSGHFGLLGMKERASKCGAELTILSASGKGSRVALTVTHRATPETPSP